MNEDRAQVYLILSRMIGSSEETTSDASAEELDEIDQIRRVVMEITDEPPRFSTST